MTRTGSTFTTMLFLLGAALLLGGAVSWYASQETPAEAPKGLSSASASAINRFCEDHKQALEQMPQHPQSQALLDQLLTLWCKDRVLERSQGLEEIAAAFPNAPLGLTALRARLANDLPSAENICRQLIPNYPDSRVACMALEALVKASPDTAEAMLDEAIARHGDSRVAVFALTVKGDHAHQRGETAEAARYWLRAWMADPKRAKPLYSNLCLFWLENKYWYYPLLMPADFLQDPVLTPVKHHALAALDGEATGTVSPRELMQEVGNALKAGEVEKAVAAIDRLMAQDGMTPEDSALFGTAIFLAATETTNTADLTASLQSKRVLTQCRERAFAWARNAMASLPRELQACYALEMARRFLQDGRLRQAIELLQSAWRDKELAPSWRARLVEELAKILLDETANIEAAARAYADYADESPPEEGRWRLLAADLLFRGKKNAQSIEQIDKLLALSQPGADRPAAILLKALNLLDQGNIQEAMAELEQLAMEHPEHPLAPEAVFLLGKAALAAGDASTAHQYYRDLMDRYPESERAEEAARIVAQTEGT